MLFAYVHVISEQKRSNGSVLTRRRKHFLLLAFCDELARAVRPEKLMNNHCRETTVLLPCTY